MIDAYEYHVNKRDEEIQKAEKSYEELELINSPTIEEINILMAQIVRNYEDANFNYDADERSVIKSQIEYL